MAFELGAIIARIKMDMTEFKKGVGQVKSDANAMKERMVDVGQGIATVSKQAAIFTGVVGAGFALFLKDASAEASNFQKAMTTLDIIAGRFNESGKKAQDTAQTLGKELRIGTGAAAEGLQNLLKSGLNLDQAAGLMKRFTNEAITGKSPTISLSQAVQNLTFAYATSNSALGNLSGVSENFEDIIKKGRESLIKKGKAVGDITDEMAKYEGMINLTNLTMGSAQRFTGTLIDKEAQLEQQMTDLKIAVGNVFNPIKALFLDLIMGSGIIGGIQDFANNSGWLVDAFKRIADWIKSNQETVMAFMKALGVALGALLILGTITIAVMALTNPLVLLSGAIAALFAAWQSNFLGIRDVSLMVFNEFMLFVNEIFIPFIQFLVAVWNDNWVYTQAILMGAWNIITGIIQTAWGIVFTILSVGLALLQGRWGAAWENMKHGMSVTWEGIKKIFGGIVQYIMGWGGTVVNALVSPFESAWNRIRDLMNKIKDALDFTKRHSPSIMDIVTRGVRLVNNAMEDLDFGVSVPTHANLAGIPAGGPTIANVNIDLDGAIIADDASAMRFAEKFGNLITRKLNTNVRY